MNLILIGPQGSGKGTQAELLAKKFKLPIIGVGRLFRLEAQGKTKLGKKVEKFMNQGLLAPDNLTEELLKNELKKSKYKQGAIFDGFPRDFAQLKLLEKLIQVDYVIFIGLSQRESIKRLGGRRVCACGQTYNIYTNKPKHDLLCDKCGKNLLRRTDDTPQAIKKRLKIFRQETFPLLRYFKKKNKLIKVNGEQTATKVFKDIIILLKNKSI